MVERTVIMAKDHVISEIELPMPNQKQARERFEDIDNDQITNSSLDDFLAHYENIYITRLLKRYKGRDLTPLQKFPESTLRPFIEK